MNNDVRNNESQTSTRPQGTYAQETSPWVKQQLETIDETGTTDSVDVQGRPVMVVTVTGRRTGLLRRVPLMRVEHDGVYLAVASKGGHPEHPAWYHSIVANPEVSVQDGSRHLTGLRARRVEGAERQEWWERAVAAFPSYADYQEKTDREIPLFVLEAAPQS